MDTIEKHHDHDSESGRRLLPDYDIESEADSDSPPKTFADGEDRKDLRETTPQTSFQSKLWYLGGWFTLNLLLTMSNKAIMTEANFPWLLTTSHTAMTAMGCYGLVGFGSLVPSRLTMQENRTMLAFSILFTINIAVSNVSLAMVSVPFHQVMRSTCPVVTVLIYRWLGRTYSQATYLSIIPLILGVVLATYGDYFCTMSGFCLTLLGVVLASIKTVATNRIMTGSLALDALEVLLRMSPLATIQCVMCAFFSGEVKQAHIAYMEGHISSWFALALLANGLVAFLLNVISLQANKAAGALTMTVAGNIKQALTILLGIVVFHVQTGALNAIGIVVTVAGAAWYSKVELKARGGG